jgi:hypothetical protein
VCYSGCCCVCVCVCVCACVCLLWLQVCGRNGNGSVARLRRVKGEEALAARRAFAREQSYRHAAQPPPPLGMPSVGVALPVAPELLGAISTELGLLEMRRWANACAEDLLVEAKRQLWGTRASKSSPQRAPAAGRRSRRQQSAEQLDGLSLSPWRELLAEVCSELGLETMVAPPT